MVWASRFFIYTIYTWFTFIFLAHIFLHLTIIRRTSFLPNYPVGRRLVRFAESRRVGKFLGFSLIIGDY
jgi:hypothetical protein